MHQLVTYNSGFLLQSVVLDQKLLSVPEVLYKRVVRVFNNMPVIILLCRLYAITVSGRLLIKQQGENDLEGATVNKISKD